MNPSAAVDAQITADLLDILASGVHDAKNQLQQAEASLSNAEAMHGIDLGAARYAIEAAALRLTQTLHAYRLDRGEHALAIQPTVISDLIEEVTLAQRPHFAAQHLELSVTCPVAEPWPLDRELLADMLNNALQNAARHARQQVALSVSQAAGGLLFCVDDDGPGFASLPPSHGLGLRLAQRLAARHCRRETCGHLRLANHGPLGGAHLELWLP